MIPPGSRRRIVRRPIAALPNLSVPPLLQRVYAARHVQSTDELRRELRYLPPFTALHQIDRAVGLLAAAVREDRRILIVADLDVDGATSCALAIRVLRAMGVRDVRYLAPNRFTHGYGLSPEIAAIAVEQRPHLLITVDNGTSSHEGVQYVQAQGIRVLITDHHLPGATLPPADALVNPNQPGDPFPGKHLAGVGVLFYVLSALRARLREEGWFSTRGIPEPNLAQFLDLVALGTVADVVPLDHINRILVAQGIERIRAGRCLPGIRALLEVANRPLERVTTTDLGFYLAPRLNAAGRLADMSLSIECLLADDPDLALRLAQRLEDLNRERKGIEHGMCHQALERLAQSLQQYDDFPFGLCLFESDWHPGILGILAGRMRERFHRPIVVFAPDVQPGQLRGSARSVPGVHIRDVLATLAARQPGLITHFGGHAMAAGLSLPVSHLPLFQTAFDAEIRRFLTEDDLQGRLLSDGELSAEDFSLTTAEYIHCGGPWGQGFPEPLFDGVFTVTSRQILKEQHLKLRLQLPGSPQTVEAIAFRQAEHCPPATHRVRIAYRLDINEWQGERRLQLQIEYLEAF